MAITEESTCPPKMTVVGSMGHAIVHWFFDILRSDTIAAVNRLI